MDLIDRGALRKELAYMWYDNMNATAEDVEKRIFDAPTVEAYSAEAVKQIMWERDMAIQQLNDYGVQLGEKADCVRVVRCKYCRRERYCEFTQYQGENGYCSLAESKDGD
jgi:hypothetical protein